jgi:hypothetical protein
MADRIQIYQQLVSKIDPHPLYMKTVMCTYRNSDRGSVDFQYQIEISVDTTVAIDLLNTISPFVRCPMFVNQIINLALYSLLETFASIFESQRTVSPV